MEPRNFKTVAAEQYRTTAVPIVHYLQKRELRKAAEDEMVKYRPGGILDGDDIYADAEAALEALSIKLGSDEWFFDAQEAGLMDAAVFGYTHLILTLPWNDGESRLKTAVARWENLANHEERVRAQCGW